MKYEANQRNDKKPAAGYRSMQPLTRSLGQQLIEITREKTYEEFVTNGLIDFISILIKHFDLDPRTIHEYALEWCYKMSYQISKEELWNMIKQQSSKNS